MYTMLFLLFTQYILCIFLDLAAKQMAAIIRGKNPIFFFSHVCEKILCDVFQMCMCVCSVELQLECLYILVCSYVCIVLFWCGKVVVVASGNRHQSLNNFRVFIIIVNKGWFVGNCYFPKYRQVSLCYNSWHEMLPQTSHYHHVVIHQLLG